MTQIEVKENQKIEKIIKYIKEILADTDTTVSESDSNYMLLRKFSATIYGIKLYPTALMCSHNCDFSKQDIINQAREVLILMYDAPDCIIIPEHFIYVDGDGYKF